MYYQSVDTAVIDTESLPWVPFTPYSDEVFVKYIKSDPIRGEHITLLKVPAGVTMPRHYHSGTVIVYTIKGAWKYLEHDWVSKPGDVVFETAATTHTPTALTSHGDEVITLNITVGDLVFLDEQGNICATENWKTGMERYVAYCKANGLEAQDITSFSA